MPSTDRVPALSSHHTVSADAIHGPREEANVARPQALGFLQNCKVADIRLQQAGRSFIGSRENPPTRAPRRKPIMSKILGTAIVAGLFLAVTAPAFAADAPKTKAECQKLTDMKWDSKTKTCVKK